MRVIKIQFVPAFRAICEIFVNLIDENKKPQPKLMQLYQKYNIIQVVFNFMNINNYFY
jgi:hypothetical protein